jgi:hypothetical protein
MRRIVVAAPALLALAVACDKGSGSTGLAPAASSLAASRSDASSSTTAWHFVVDPKSTTHVELPGLKEHIKGDTSVAAGTLDVTPADLGQARGLVRIDLTTFETKTFGDDHDATQTKHARTWLEAVAGDKINEEMRWAEFAIRSIDDLGAKDLTKISATKTGAEDVRSVSMTVHGELLVHGRKVPKDAVVDVSFGYPPGAPADSKPSWLEIKSKQPLTVVLKEHDVRPRDPGGQVLAWTTNLIAKVADAADVTVDIRATPAR